MSPHQERRQDLYVLLGVGIVLLYIAWLLRDASAPVILAALWALSVVAVAGIVVHEIVIDHRARKRTLEYEASRERSIAKRLADDAQVAELEAIPTMDWDPEALGS